MPDKSKDESKNIRSGDGKDKAIIASRPPLAPVNRATPSNSRRERTTPALAPVDKPHVNEPQSPGAPESGTTETASSEPAPSQDADSQGGDSSD